MDRNTYVDTVLSFLRDLTAGERESVQAEIDGHIEDHMAALLDLGYGEALAEERALSAMGDPETVGRELNRQYPIRWQVLKDIATGFIAILLGLALFLGGNQSDFWQGLVVRFDPERVVGREGMGWTMDTNARLSAGSDIVKAYRVSRWDSPAGPMVTVDLCAYDRIPGGVVSATLEETGILTVENQRGKAAEVVGVKTAGSYSAKYLRAYVPVEEGDTYVTLCYDQYGRSARCDIPLPEVEP